MPETEFTQLTEQLFDKILQTLDTSAGDIDSNLNGGVLELEFENGGKVIINRHAPNQEIWLAAKTGAYHFSLDQERWMSRRDGREFFSTLSEIILQNSGSKLAF